MLRSSRAGKLIYDPEIEKTARRLAKQAKQQKLAAEVIADSCAAAKLSIADNTANPRSSSESELPNNIAATPGLLLTLAAESSETLSTVAILSTAATKTTQHTDPIAVTSATLQVIDEACNTLHSIDNTADLSTESSADSESDEEYTTETDSTMGDNPAKTLREMAAPDGNQPQMGSLSPI